MPRKARVDAPGALLHIITRVKGREDKLAGVIENDLMTLFERQK